VRQVKLAGVAGGRPVKLKLTPAPGSTLSSPPLSDAGPSNAGKEADQGAGGQTPSAVELPPSPAPEVAAITPPAPVARVPLRAWLPGQWRSTGGAVHLTISGDLGWEFTSTGGGTWHASGTTYFESRDTVVLRGWVTGTDSYGRPSPRPSPISIAVRRDDDQLTGEIQGSQVWPVVFRRSSSGGR
jgi:hypothetical protein